MISNKTVFRIMCSFLAFFITILTTSPIAMLALPADNAIIKPIERLDKTTVAVSPLTKSSSKQQKPQIPTATVLHENIADTVIEPTLPLYDKFTVAQRNQKNLPCKLPPVNYYYGKKTVYLTFDDGPDPENTPIILDILKQSQIKATFFVVGTQVKDNPQILKRIYLEGHAIGNHSFNHEYSDLYQSAESYVAQLHKNEELIMSILGVRPRISRAPGGTVGSFTKEYWNILTAQGYVDIGWNIASGDASSSSAAMLVANVAKQLEVEALWSHSIVLMHDGAGHNETVKALPQIIELYKSRGFEFRLVNIQTPPAW